MRYFEGDIIKIDASIQQLGVNYEIFCPFVTATEDSDEVGSGCIWADGRLRNVRTGNVIDGRFLYFIGGSVLYQRAEFEV